MHVSKLRIQRFKSFEDVTVELNPDLNVFTGVNNSGKTTVLEAAALWVECLRKCTAILGRSISKKHVRRGEYELQARLVEIESVRCPNFADIFYQLDTAQTVRLEAEVTHKGRSRLVGFEVRAARGGNYSAEPFGPLKVKPRDFNDFFEARPRAALEVVYASPVATLLARESFETLPKVRASIRTRDSMRVLRNRLFQLRKDSLRFHEFSVAVGDVLADGKEEVQFETSSDEANDVDLTLRIKIGPADVFKDVSLFGSGTVQILEIMLALYAAPSEQAMARLVMLDEPDSYIHRDQQRRLLSRLVNHASGTQVFVATHNESFIRATRVEHLFHLESRTKRTYRPIAREPLVLGQNVGLQPSAHLRLLRAVGSESAVDLLNALESDRLVLVEGPDDAVHLQAIVDQEKVGPHPSLMFWSFGGVDSLLALIGKYREFFQSVRNATSLWDRAVVAFDRDYLTDAQRQRTLDGLSRALGRPVYVSTSYTLEATLLSEPAKLAELVSTFVTKAGGASSGRETAKTLEAQRVALKAVLAARVADPGFLNDLFHRARARREKLASLQVRPNPFGTNDAVLQTDFTTFARAALASDALHLLATKDDVAHVLRGALAALAPKLELPEDWFLRFVRLAGVSTWLDEWSEAARAVTGP
jgi:hypothetical protein